MNSSRASLAVAALALSLVRGAEAQTVATEGGALHTVVDRWVEHGLRRYQIAGAALAIVRDGSIVHRRGFGLADVARGHRVDPDSTVFHIASVTKLLTAIAALQQVEAGRLELRQDIRPLLGVIRATGWDRHRVTLHDLLTHTAGLDTRWIGMATEDPADVRTLAEYLPRAMPPIMDAPGSVVRYSNHGYAAIGRAVEVASGLPWADYVEQRILAPLEMRRSYAGPRAPGAHHAVPYRYRRDTTPEPNVHEHAAPGGAARSTATDVARLLVALLDTTSEVPLSLQGKRMLLTPQHRIGSDVPGFAYGTFEYPNARVRAMSMGGEVPGFSTRLLIVPELGLGVVLMINRKDPTLAVGVFDSLLARLAVPRSDLAPRATDARRNPPSIDEIGGRYRGNVYERASFLRIGALLGPTLSVRRDTGESLVVVNPIDDAAGRWQRSGDSMWTEPGGARMSLVSGGGASVLAITTKVAGPVMLERVTAATDPSIVLPVAAIAMIALLIALCSGLWQYVVEKGRESSRLVGQARALTVAVPVVHLTFLVAFAIGLYQLAIEYDDRFAFGLPRWFTGVLTLPYLSLAATALLALVLVRGRAKRGMSRWRGWLVVAASSLLLVALWSWRAVWTG